MRRDERGHNRRSAAGATLRREALDTRPRFSEAFHERLVRRLPGAATPRRSPPAGSSSSPAARRTMMPLAVAAGLVGGMVLFLTRPGRDGLPGRPDDRIAAGATAEVIGNDLGGRGRLGATADPAEEPLGIDRLPMFDELEEELRAGLTTLAVSLLEMPEWEPLATLAGEGLPDFDGPPSRATSP